MAKTSNFAGYLDRALQASLFLLALSAPLSIAATQTAWSFALLFWIIRAFFVRPTLRKGGIDLAMLAFLGLTILSSIFSYEPGVSLRKLVSVSLVTIAYLISENIRGTSMLRKIVTVLLLSASFTGVWAIGTFVIGKNMKVVKLSADSALRTAGVQENDTILAANGKNVSSPDDLANAASSAANGVVTVRVYHYELFFNYDVPVSALNTSADNATRFGITEWSRGRDVRAAGFYGHYTTYAEAIQLLLSLALGLLIFAPGGIFERNKMLLGVAVALMATGLVLTVTRASWAGFAVSAGVMVLFGTSRKTIIICIALAIPVAAAGIFYLQQKRNVAFIDTNDGSTTWRMTVWREGAELLVSNPRHLVIGVGMDSLKTHWQEWHLFDNGNIPMGHMHSTPLQFALERGIPTLIAWMIWMFIYLRMLWRGFRRKDASWHERGLLLGALGGAAGFLAGGLVHYNWGDSEVAMVFYVIMGLSLAALKTMETPPEDVQTA